MASRRQDSPDGLSGALSSICEEAGIPGMSVAASYGKARVQGHTGVACAAGEAPLTDQSRFQVSCLMKFFMSIIASRLKQQGVVQTDQPIGRYLTELAGSEAGERVCVNHLLSHTSGYRGLDITDGKIRWGTSWKTLVDHLRGTRLSFPPGYIFNYEHSEHVLVGEILARLTGRSVDQLLTEELLAPLGIQLEKSRQDSSSPGFVGQHAFSKTANRFVTSSVPNVGEFWRASLPDLTIRLQDVLTLGEWILAEENGALRTGLADQIIDFPAQVAASLRVEEIPLSFGTICGRYAGNLFGHNGSVLGQTVAMRLDVEHQEVFAVGVNAWVPHARDRAIRLLAYGAGDDLADSSSGDERIGFEFPAMAGRFRAADLIGTYEGGFSRQVDVEQGDAGALIMRLGPPGPRQVAMAATVRADGLYEFRENPYISCRFVPHPEDNSPVLLLGVHAYRRKRV